MKPELVSIRLDTVTPTASIVQVVYRAPVTLEGLELQGVDAELSWLKGQSVSLEMESTDEKTANYIGHLEVTDSCEFRARGFAGEEDYWEAGLSNHRITRNEDGTIEFETEIEKGLYHFKGSLPTNYNPSHEEVEYRISNIEEEDVPLFQALVDLSIWIDRLPEDPLKETNIYPLAGVIRHLKVKTRNHNSKLVDDVARPVIHAVFMMYKSALEFAEDDIRYMTGEWIEQGYVELIKDLPDKIRELEQNPNIGRGSDYGDRFKELLRYVS